jgi:hypothetical protein
LQLPKSRNIRVFNILLERSWKFLSNSVLHASKILKLQLQKKKEKYAIIQWLQIRVVSRTAMEKRLRFFFLMFYTSVWIWIRLYNYFPHFTWMFCNIHVSTGQKYLQMHYCFCTAPSFIFDWMNPGFWCCVLKRRLFEIWKNFVCYVLPFEISQKANVKFCVPNSTHVHEP